MTKMADGQFQFQKGVQWAQRTVALSWRGLPLPISPGDVTTQTVSACHSRGWRGEPSGSAMLRSQMAMLG